MHTWSPISQKLSFLFPGMMRSSGRNCSHRSFASTSGGRFADGSPSKYVAYSLAGSRRYTCVSSSHAYAIASFLKYLPKDQFPSISKNVWWYTSCMLHAALARRHMSSCFQWFGAASGLHGRAHDSLFSTDQSHAPDAAEAEAEGAIFKVMLVTSTPTTTLGTFSYC